MDGDWRAREDCIGLLLERQVRTGLDGDGMVTKGGDLMNMDGLNQEIKENGWIKRDYD